MLLNLSNGDAFATGAAGYSYRPAYAGDSTDRIFVSIEIGGSTTEAVVDTGGLYFVCPPEFANSLSLDTTEGIGPTSLQIRGFTLTGSLYRLKLGLVAEQGTSLQLEVTAFVPNDEWYPNAWNLPAYLGFYCCLERLRIAIDPSTDTFFFGPPS